MKKEDFIKHLRDNEIFKSILSQTTDDKEKRLIKAYAEDFMLKFYQNIYEPLHSLAEKDPEAAKKEFIKIENDLINSGSINAAGH